MHSRILAEREAQATERIMAAAAVLSDRLAQPDLLALLEPEPSRDPRVAELYRREAIAVYLETLNTRLAETPAAKPGKKA